MYKTPLNASTFQKKYIFNSGEKLVETAGYIPAQKRIENLMLAGQRLVASRQALYDCQGGEEFDDTIPFDPTRDPGYDLADAAQDSLGIAERLKDRVANKESKDSRNAVAPSEESEGEGGGE